MRDILSLYVYYSGKDAGLCVGVGWVGGPDTLDGSTLFTSHLADVLQTNAVRTIFYLYSSTLNIDWLQSPVTKYSYLKIH